MPLADLAREFEMSVPGIGYAVERGEVIAHDNKYQLITFNFLVLPHNFLSL